MPNRKTNLSSFKESAKNKLHHSFYHLGFRHNTPRATYRLQLNFNFTLKEATELIPYFSRLGISHIYTNSLLQAYPGSQHGYNVCDFQKINREIGTEADLTHFVKLLHQNNMGLIVDVVPNHMCIDGLENKWWQDVLRLGGKSSYANFFDIDWNSPIPDLKGKVMLPILGEEYKEALESGKITLARSAQSYSINYFDHSFPLSPEGIDFLKEFQDLEEINQDKYKLDQLIKMQNYCLAFYRRGDTELNYRCFFDITSLARIKVENLPVFEATHTHIHSWYKKGYIDGLRIDHIDGLVDPENYLKRLRRMFPKTWIVVEKLLVQEEKLPEWPIEGTVGYDFLHRVNGLFVDSTKEKELSKIYTSFSKQIDSYQSVFFTSKVQALREHLFSDIAYLSRIFQKILQSEKNLSEFSFDQISKAIIILAATFPVRRTYNAPRSFGLSAQDLKSLSIAIKAAKEKSPELSTLFEHLNKILKFTEPEKEQKNFIAHFQELTASAMVKGVEDTTFYRYNRLSSLNDLGGDRGDYGLTLEQFHKLTKDSFNQWPNSMLALSTHDTKRSEDVRARINLISEIPKEWQELLQTLSFICRKYKQSNFPDENTEYLFYQTLVGAWPVSLERILAYMKKASYEAKKYTSWKNPNHEYDNALKNFITSSYQDQDFQKEIDQFVKNLVDPGYTNSLSQTLIKLTSPGVPDFYQGTEVWNFTLVDPDNRRKVDFSLPKKFAKAISNLEPEEIWQSRNQGLPKIYLIEKVLSLRKKFPSLFKGTYKPIHTLGHKKDHVVSYSRSGKLIIVAPRLNMSLLNKDWADTAINLPRGQWQNLLTRQTYSEKVFMSTLFDQFPVALLVSENTAIDSPH